MPLYASVDFGGGVQAQHLARNFQNCKLFAFLENNKPGTIEDGPMAGLPKLNRSPNTTGDSVHYWEFRTPFSNETPVNTGFFNVQGVTSHVKESIAVEVSEPEYLSGGGVRWNQIGIARVDGTRDH